MKSIGERFAIALKELKLSNKEILDEFNTSSQHISNLKKSEKINDLMCQIANHYNININWIVSGEGERFIYDSNTNNFQNSTNVVGQDFSNNSNAQHTQNNGNTNDIDENVLKLVDTLYSFAKANDKIDDLKKDLSSLLPKYM